jgi:TRAP-type C4-dicarboxylate transport system permease small subunit
MADVKFGGEPGEAKPERYGVLFYLGAGGLLGAMSIEAIAVTGRQIGVPLLGALELIQTAILIAASVAMLSATIVDGHATVKLLVERLSPRTQAWLHRIALLVSAAFFACLAFSAGWLTLESWGEYEHSELLRIPYLPLRIIVVVTTTAITLVLAYKALRPVAAKDSAQ